MYNVPLLGLHVHYPISKDKRQTLVNKLDDDYWYVNIGYYNLGIPLQATHKCMNHIHPLPFKILIALLRNNHGLENL